MNKISEDGQESFKGRGGGDESSVTSHLYVPIETRMYNQSVGLSPIQGVIMEPLKNRQAGKCGGLSLYVRKLVIIMTQRRLAQEQHALES
jgi:hypothetical protein